MTHRGLVANGDPRNLATFSNIPHFFLKAGMKNGLLHSGVVLRPEELRTRRFLWNAVRPLTLDRPGGWTYSRRYARTVWPRREVDGEVEEYISHYQLLPPRDAVREPITYYIDATMRQWFDEYGYRIGRRVRADALAREREAYLSARYVVGMSDWCAEDVISSYGVPREQVRTILPAANIDEESLPPAEEWSGELSPLRLGLVGIDWERKGGPLLLEAASILGRMGHDVEVVVVGPDPSRVPAHPALRALGYVHKGTGHPALRRDRQKLSLRLPPLPGRGVGVLGARVPPPRHPDHHDRGRRDRRPEGRRTALPACGRRGADRRGPGWRFLQTPIGMPRCARQRLETAWSSAGIERRRKC